MRTFESVADLAAAAGEKVGQSDWVTITQEEVNLFADATGDHQWIHVDPERAAAGPFGTTIAHGFMPWRCSRACNTRCTPSRASSWQSTTA